MIFSNRARVLAARLFPWFERAVVAVVCWQAAGIAWGLFAPDAAGPMPVPPRLAPTHAESRDALLGWFGGEAPVEAQTASDYTLMAVIAGRRDGVALLKGSDGQSVAVRTGAAVDAGSRLVSVEPAAATLDRGGTRQEIKLPQTGTSPIIASATGATGATGGVPAKSAPAKTAPAEVIRITHGQMIAVMRSGNVAGWDKGLSDAPDGGIRIDQVAAQGFAQLLQLKDGDILKSVNKRVLARVADVSLLFFHFGQNPSVKLELIRNGASMTQGYDIQP
jgi:hypothetical protein